MAGIEKAGAGPISLLIRATIEGYGGDTDPAHQVLQEWIVTAEAVWSDDQGEGSEQVGEAKGYLIDLAEMLNHPPDGLSLFEILDDDHQDLGELYEVFIAPETERLREDLFPDSFASQIIYIERLYMEPKWRWQRIGWTIVAQVSHLIGRNTALVVVIPRPLDVPAEDPRFEGLSRTLEHYYEGLGFRKAQDNRFWWADPDFRPTGDRFFQERTRVVYRIHNQPESLARTSETRDLSSQPVISSAITGAQDGWHNRYRMAGGPTHEQDSGERASPAVGSSALESTVA